MAKYAAAVLCLALASVFAVPAIATEVNPSDYSCNTLGATCSNVAFYYSPVCYSASTCVAFNGGQYCHATTFNNGGSCDGALYGGNPCYNNFQCSGGLCYGAPKCGPGSSCNAGTCGPAPTAMVPDDKWLYGDNKPVTVYRISSSAVYSDVLYYKYKEVERKVEFPSDPTKPAMLGFIGKYDTIHFSIKVYDEQGNYRDQWYEKDLNYGTAHAKRTQDAGTGGVTIGFEDRRDAEPDRPEAASLPKDYNDLVIAVYGVRTSRSA